AIERDTAARAGPTSGRRLTGSPGLPGAVILLPLDDVEVHASVLCLPALGADRLDHVRVCEGRRIAEGALLRDVTKQTTHDLAGAGLGQVRREAEEFRFRGRSDDLGDVPPQLLGERLRRVHTASKDHVGEDRLTGDRIVLAAARLLRARLVVDQRRLHLDRRDPVAGYVHDVVDAAEQPEVALVVALRPIPSEVPPRTAAPVRFLVPLGVSVDAPEHARPRSLQVEVASPAEWDAVPVAVDHVRLDAGEREGGSSRFRDGDAGEWRDEDLARLGLPPRVDDRSTPAA